MSESLTRSGINFKKSWLSTQEEPGPIMDAAGSIIHHESMFAGEHHAVYQKLQSAAQWYIFCF